MVKGFLLLYGIFEMENLKLMLFKFVFNFRSQRIETDQIFEIPMTLKAKDGLNSSFSNKKCSYARMLQTVC